MTIQPHLSPRLCPSMHLMFASTTMVACLTVVGLAADTASGGAVPEQRCLTNALSLSEALEPVIEAVTDGRPNRVPLAATRAQAWWAAHRTSFANPAALDTAMSSLHTLASTHRAPLAARAALVASTAALDACSETPTEAAHLMRIDLAGMAGWLRAHGVDAPFPRGVAQAAQSIDDRLRASGHGAMAEGLRKELAATLAIPVRVEGNVHAADSLLQRVDEIEQALR